MAAPSWANARHVAAPMAPPPPPVTTTTQPARGFSALPSFACSRDQYSTSKQVGLARRLEAPDRLGVRDRLDGALGYVGGDARVGGRPAEAEEPDAGDQHDSGHRVELSLGVWRGGSRCA